MIWTVLGWATIGLMTSGAILVVLSIDRPRRPTTAGVAVATVIVDILVILTVYNLLTGGHPA